MKTQQNFHQVRCTKDSSNRICGDGNMYCFDCQMKPLDGIAYTYYFPQQHLWQTCPLCGGTGLTPIPGTYNIIPACPTCKGKRIISTLTGLPPQ